MTSRTDLSALAPQPLTNVSREPSANNAFIGCCHDFDLLIEKLQAVRALNFGVDADRARSWAEAGSVSHVNERLAEVLRFITGTEA